MVVLLCGVFFFKQKTAYEMRISDWSSDVCSSDLERDAGNCGQYDEPGSHRAKSSGDTLTPRWPAAAPGRDTTVSSPRRSQGVTRADRKSVVEGKGVSVRVDIGGRRIIKKKRHIDVQDKDTIQPHDQQTIK